MISVTGNHLTRLSLFRSNSGNRAGIKELGSYALSAFRMTSLHTDGGRREKAGSPKCYPETTFDTELLPTDDMPIVFADASSSSSPLLSSCKEPLRRVALQQCGETTLKSLERAAKALQQGLPVAFPTETVYGLSANALSHQACKAVFEAKGRPQDNPLIVHVCDLNMAEQIVSAGWTPPKAYDSLMKRFWPGGITFLVPAATTDPSDDSSSTHLAASALPFFNGIGTSKISCDVTAGHPLVGVRMPSHPLARALICISGLPLAAPSANASGRPSPTSAHHVMYDLGGGLDSCVTSSTNSLRGRIPYVLNGGASRQGVESTVVDGATDPGQLRVLRPGAVSLEEIEECLRSDGITEEQVLIRVYGKDMQRKDDMEANPTTPGMKYRHYSPNAPVTLFAPSAASAEVPTGPPPWQMALARKVRECTTAKKSPGHDMTIKVGVMMLIDSPFCAAICSDSRVQFGESNRSWLASQRSLMKRSTPSSHSGITDPVGDRHADEEELDACLGPSFNMRLPMTAQSSFGPSKNDTNSEFQIVQIVPFSLGSIDQPELAARRLFSGMRTLDDEERVGQQVRDGQKGTWGSSRASSVGSVSRSPVDLIIVEAVKETGIGLAVMNRLGKAAGRPVFVSV